MDLAGLQAMLDMVKQLPSDKIEEQFYKLMIKAKDIFGEESFPMGQFYYEYGNFILGRLQKNVELFNNDAVPDNVHHDQNEQIANMEEVFDDSEPLADGKQEEKEAGAAENNQPEIVENNQSQIGVEQNAGEQEVQAEEQSSDKEICYVNLQMAIKVFEKELQLVKAGASTTLMDEILKKLRRAHTRLGDLYMLDEEYALSIEEYRGVIIQEMSRDGSESNRLIAELHYLVGNALLYDNKENCETQAIGEFTRATRILVRHLAVEYNYDISAFEIPSEEKITVDRFGYLPKPYDSEGVKQIKDVLSCLLDKIEDTFDQIGVREAYEKEKKKLEEEKKHYEFKPVADPEKVINLGSFGNRKKKPEEALKNEQQEGPWKREEKKEKKEQEGKKEQGAGGAEEQTKKNQQHNVEQAKADKPQ